MILCRRLTSFAATLVAVACLFAPPAAAAAFGFDDVAKRAAALAAKPYAKPAQKLPKELMKLGYDQYRDIRFRTDRFHWRGTKSPFELAFFHPGYNFDQPVRISGVSAEGVREIRFNPDDFHYGANKLDTAKIGRAHV